MAMQKAINLALNMLGDIRQLLTVNYHGLGSFTRVSSLKAKSHKDFNTVSIIFLRRQILQMFSNIFFTNIMPKIEEGGNMHSR